MVAPDGEERRGEWADDRFVQQGTSAACELPPATGGQQQQRRLQQQQQQQQRQQRQQPRRPHLLAAANNDAANADDANARHHQLPSVHGVHGNRSPAAAAAATKTKPQLKPKLKHHHDPPPPPPPPSLPPALRTGAASFATATAMATRWGPAPTPHFRSKGSRGPQESYRQKLMRQRAEAAAAAAAAAGCSMPRFAALPSIHRQ
jgi:hypothetical protein